MRISDWSSDVCSSDLGRFDGRGQHAETCIGPRRAALHRRDHARRVPQVRREGRRARAPLPEGVRRRAECRGHDREPDRKSAVWGKRLAVGLDLGGRLFLQTKTKGYKCITKKYI